MSALRIKSETHSYLSVLVAKSTSPFNAVLVSESSWCVGCTVCRKNCSPNNRKSDFTLFPSKSETSLHKARWLIGTLQLAVQSFAEQSTSILRGFIHITSHRSKTIATKQEPSRLMPPRLSLLDSERPKVTLLCLERRNTLVLSPVQIVRQVPSNEIPRWTGGSRARTANFLHRRVNELYLIIKWLFSVAEWWEAALNNTHNPSGVVWDHLSQSAVSLVLVTRGAYSSSPREKQQQQQTKNEKKKEAGEAGNQLWHLMCCNIRSR